MFTGSMRTEQDYGLPEPLALCPQRVGIWIPLNGEKQIVYTEDLIGQSSTYPTSNI